MITYHKISCECSGNNGKEYRVEVEPDFKEDFFLVTVTCLDDGKVVADNEKVISKEGLFKALSTGLMVWIP